MKNIILLTIVAIGALSMTACKTKEGCANHGHSAAVCCSK